MVKLVEGQSLNCMIEFSNPHGCCFQFSAQTHFPLLGKEKIPLGVGYIFESKFPLVVRIGLAARACGSGNGQSPSNSAEGHSSVLYVPARPKSTTCTIE